jgi:nucleotide-binding universal stress UspA family protein
MDRTITNMLIICNTNPCGPLINTGVTLARKCKSKLHLLLPENEKQTSLAETLRSEIKKTGLAEPEIRYGPGTSLKHLLQAAKDSQADLVVLCQQSKEPTGIFQHSTAFKLACASDCPVLTIPEVQDHHDFSRMLVHLDATPETRQKLGTAGILAAACGAEVHVVGATREKDRESTHHLDVFCSHAEKYFQDKGLKTSCSTASGVNVGETLKERAEQIRAGLVVMMTETEPAGMFATPYTEWLMKQQSVPVLAMRPREMGVAGGGL